MMMMMTCLNRALTLVQHRFFFSLHFFNSFRGYGNFHNRKSNDERNVLVGYMRSTAMSFYIFMIVRVYSAGPVALFCFVFYNFPLIF